MTRALTFAIVVSVAAGCRGHASEPVAATGDAAPPDSPPPSPPPDAGPAVTAIADADARAFLARERAIAAWSAVVDRDRYLRRSERVGVVHGRLGGAVDGGGDRERWLVDDDEGEGSLGIRVVLPPRVAVAPGARVAVRGGWESPAPGRWVWSADEVFTLGDAGEAPPAPDRQIEVIDDAPADAVAVSEVSRRRSTVTFVVVGPPRTIDEGWAVADQADSPAVARIVLPGERQTYGGQDMLGDDERWRLRTGARYVVVVARRHLRAGRDGLPRLRALGAPRQLR